MISIKQIHYALAIEKTLHFKKAADLCNVSQSALSTAIHELEKQLGVMIFERNNKQVLVTSNGRLILERAKRVKIELDELVQIAQRDKKPFINPLTLGVIPTVGPYLLPKVLPEVRQQYPSLKLNIIEDQSHVLVEQIRNGEIDAAIMALPYPIDGLMSFDFWQEDFYWVCHKDECPQKLQEITSEELAIDELMLLKDGHCLKEHALAACRFKARKSDSGFDSASLYTLIQMVAGKLGTTLVPHMAIDQLVTNESELSAIHLNEPGPHRTIAFVIRPNFARAKELTLLQNIFTKQLERKCYDSRNQTIASS
ncbi:hydrogen peroxide-inducible genes activator [Thalassotalea atypica]|uniref:hydrogen peroxide-inducible genes activator n=1 Tax=Thalassotalea atypica TaxID=2054316 RepID=UPI00257342FA|nr:hydrogen peroxide-inducible genes activator [Thalassotalea atypica]